MTLAQAADQVDALHKAAQENPVSDPEPELDIRSDSGEADGGITLQL